MPDLEIIPRNDGDLDLTALDLNSLTDWPSALKIDYLNLNRAVNSIINTVNVDFGTMALQDADDVNITGGSISNVTLDNITIDDVTINNVTVVNLTATGTVNLHDVTVTGYFHSQGITDDATTEQINITDTLVEIHQDTAIGEVATVTYVTFDGTNDYMLRGGALTGVAGSKFGTIAARIRVAGSGNRDIFNGSFGGASSCKFQLVNGTNVLLAQMSNVANSNNAVFIQSTSAYTSANGWINILISWDCLNDTEGQLYVNDVNDYDAASDLDNETLGYAACTNWAIGAESFGAIAAKFNGDMAFLWVDFTTAIDFSITANRRLFFDADGFPVDLGANGETPTGTSPIMYFDGVAAEFPTNKGTGGGMTLTGDITGGTDLFGQMQFTGAGYYSGSAVGGAMGSETFNAVGYFDDGVEVPTISSTSTLTNKTISLDSNTLTATGGANGQIPIYGTSAGKFDNATLTAGNGISITNADTSITLAMSSANEATDTTCFPLFITASGTQTLQPKNNASLTFNSNTANLGAAALSVTGTTVPANGMYLPAANTLGWAVNSGGEIQLTASAFSPIANDGNALGTSLLGWADLFLATGGIVDFGAGNYTITHSAGLLTTNGALSLGTGTGNIGWSAYTPTLTNVANLDASTAYSCQWMRVGNTITVSGRVDVDPTAPAASTQLGISLPVASNLANSNECAGTAFCPTIAGQGAAVLGDATNDRAQMEFIAADTTNQPMYFQFTYRII